ncbi:MAG: YqaJ viral recombinase family protein, partial [Rhodocyclaceae bacterium]|nr:YqaJ viral recombinase family protein [Rhodocyclaceae bacterium]
NDWLAWRRGGIGSSDATLLAAAAGLVPMPKWAGEQAIQSLFWDKLGMAPAKPDTEAMRRGRDLEETARAMAEKSLGFIAPMNLERRDLPWLRASFDGLTLDDEIVEIKVPNRQVVDLARQGVVVDYYRAQIAHQALVLHGTNPAAWPKQQAHFVVLDHESGELHIVSQPLQEYAGLAAALLEAEQAFWQQVCQRQAPVGGRAWHDLALKLSRCKTRQAQAEQVKEQLRQAVARGEYEPQHFAVRRTAASQRTRIDWAAAVAEAGLSDDVLQAYRQPAVWVVSGGVQDLPETQWHPADAERMLLALQQDEQQLEELAAQAKAMAAELGPLVGPHGLRVAQRQGSLDHKRLLTDGLLKQELLERHTQRVQQPESIALVARKIKADA